MALWDKVKNELDRAGRVAQSALDEGKLRLEAMRTRQLADKAAQAIGYAVYRARQAGQEVDADSYARLSSTLAAREAEAKSYEDRLAEVKRSSRGTTYAHTAADAAPGSSRTTEPGATEDTTVP